MQLEQVILKIKNLKVDKAHGVAPHKPILLLSIFQAIELKLIKENKIYITPEIVAIFKTNWSKLVISKHQCQFSLPFYYLQSDGFWNLKPKIGYEKIIETKGLIRSFNQLNASIKYATFKEDFFIVISNKLNRDILIETILDNYFLETKNNLNDINYNYLNEIENNIINESPQEYVKQIKNLKDNLTQESYEEEIYLRSGIFKKEIPKIYNNTCCISNLRIDAILNVSMIDACHIIPFSESYNDTITNGIALCPNLHRAFDRGLISIDQEFKVVVSKLFIEQNSQYSIKQFKNKKIFLPINKKYIPNLENLKWHMENIFKK